MIEATLQHSQKASPALLQSVATLRLSADHLVGMLEKLRALYPFVSVTGLDTALRQIALARETNRGLADHLFEASREMPLPRRTRQLLFLLIHSIDSDGFLHPEEITKDVALTKTEQAQLDEAIDILQHLAPGDIWGIGARDIRESLLIQLDNLPLSVRAQHKTAVVTFAKKLISDHLDEIMRGQHHRLPRSAHTADSIKLIRHLNPYPGRIFNTDDAPPVFADVAMQRQHGLWRAVDAAALRVYCERRPAPAMVRQINYLLDQRRTLLVDVAQLVIDRQLAYLTKKSGRKSPFSLSDAANLLGFSRSFMSHIIYNKHIDTPRGTVALKSLFTRARLPNMNHAADDIADHIKKLILTESKNKPLSDRELCDLLRAREIHIARRTVCKYRRQLGLMRKSLRG